MKCVVKLKSGVELGKFSQIDSVEDPIVDLQNHDVRFKYSGDEEDLLNHIRNYDSFDTLAFLQDDKKIVVYKNEIAINKNDEAEVKKFDELVYENDEETGEVLEKHYGVTWF